MVGIEPHRRIIQIRTVQIMAHPDAFKHQLLALVSLNFY